MSNLPTNYVAGSPNPAAAVNQTNSQVNADTSAIAAMAPGSNEWLIAITLASGFTFTSRTLNTHEAITSGNVQWPDGVIGVFTTTTLSTAFPGAIDAFTVTYQGSTTKTVTQLAVTRDSAGNITAQPAPIVS